MTMSVWRKRRRILLGTVAIAVASLLLAYLSFIFLVAKPLPPHWSAALGKLNFGQIRSELGTPPIDMSAKDYQGWVIEYPWGRKVLEIAASNCCGPTVRPSFIHYSVYVNGKYRPIYSEFIFDDES
jgi:hypothetical protein